MAKKCKKSSKCPEPFNTLINIAAGATMNVIANKMENKYRYQKHGKINPYRASAFGLCTGKFENTEDLIKLGGFMGAMGAFDTDDSEADYDNASASKTSYSYDFNEPWEFDNLGDSGHINDNRYAWRMNCVDGSDYGIDPEDYETRDEYNSALLMEMDADNLEKEEINHLLEANDNIIENKLNSKYTYCKVARLDNGVNDYYQLESLEFEVGDLVVVPTDIGTSNAIITYIQEYSTNDLPKPIEITKSVIGKIDSNEDA